MPLLRETERSVRLYFVVGGIFWIVTGIRGVSDLAVVLQLPVRYAIAGSDGKLQLAPAARQPTLRPSHPDA